MQVMRRLCTADSLGWVSYGISHYSPSYSKRSAVAVMESVELKAKTESDETAQLCGLKPKTTTKN